MRPISDRVTALTVLLFICYCLTWGFGEFDFDNRQQPAFDYNEMTLEEYLLQTRVELNRAGMDELTALPQVGEKLAQAIVDYRNAHGAFESIEDLALVPGIGTKRMEELRFYIYIE